MRKLVFAVALLAAGCGGGGPVGVSGTVTFDGKPLEGATVTFSPEGSNDVGGSYGKTGPDGRYTLRTVAGDKPGAAAGKHRVSVSLTKANPKNPEGAVGELIPARYNSRSDLTFEVPAGGTDKADFTLTK